MYMCIITCIIVYHVCHNTSQLFTNCVNFKPRVYGYCTCTLTYTCYRSTCSYSNTVIHVPSCDMKACRVMKMIMLGCVSMLLQLTLQLT